VLQGIPHDQSVNLQSMQTEHDCNIPMSTVANTYQESLSSSSPIHSAIRQEQEHEHEHQYERNYEQKHEQRQELVPPSNAANPLIVPFIPHITRIPSLKKEPGVEYQPSMIITSTATSTSTTCSSTTSGVLNQNAKRRKTTDNIIEMNNGSFISGKSNNNDNNNINKGPTMMDVEVDTIITVDMWAKILLLLDNFENSGLLTPLESLKSRVLVYKQYGGLHTLFNTYVKPNIIDYTIFVKRLRELVQCELNI